MLIYFFPSYFISLSDIDRVALVKNRTPMFNFEEVLYNVSISRLSSPIQKPPLLSKDLHRPVCASKVSTSPIQGLFARTKEEMQTFRDDMHRYIGLNHPKNRCPPPTTYLLLRPETEGRLAFFLFFLFICLIIIYSFLSIIDLFLTLVFNSYFFLKKK